MIATDVHQAILRSFVDGSLLTNSYKWEIHKIVEHKLGCTLQKIDDEIADLELRGAVTNRYRYEITRTPVYRITDYGREIVRHVDTVH